MSEAWGAQEVRERLRPAFEWLSREWTAGRVWAGDLEKGFLAELSLTDETEVPVVERLFLRLRALGTEGERRGVMLLEGERERVLSEVLERAEPAPYWDGERWLVWNASAQDWWPMSAD